MTFKISNPALRNFLLIIDVVFYVLVAAFAMYCILIDLKDFCILDSLQPLPTIAGIENHTIIEKVIRCKSDLIQLLIYSLFAFIGVYMAAHNLEKSLKKYKSSAKNLGNTPNLVVILESFKAKLVVMSFVCFGMTCLVILPAFSYFETRENNACEKIRLEHQAIIYKEADIQVSDLIAQAQAGNATARRQIPALYCNKYCLMNFKNAAQDDLLEMREHIQNEYFSPEDCKNKGLPILQELAETGDVSAKAELEKYNRRLKY